MNAKSQSQDTAKAWSDPDDAPELTETFFEQGVWEVAGKAMSRPQAQEELAKHRGRPIDSGNKVSTTMRFDAEILDAFKGTGEGWQTHLNDELKDWLRLRRR